MAIKAFSLISEFRNFALKGNVIDLAVGVIIGAAFGAITKSLVDDIFMPMIALVVPNVSDVKDLVWTINGTDIRYGNFLAVVINFLIVALVLFIFIVKFLGWVMNLRRKEAEAAPPPPPPAPTKEELLLAEIRDAIRAQGQR